jgi:hypothetical protein
VARNLTNLSGSSLAVKLRLALEEATTLIVAKVVRRREKALAEVFRVARPPKGLECPLPEARQPFVQQPLKIGGGRK